MVFDLMLLEKLSLLESPFTPLKKALNVRVGVVGELLLSVQIQICLTIQKSESPTVFKNPLNSYNKAPATLMNVTYYCKQPVLCNYFL